MKAFLNSKHSDKNSNFISRITNSFAYGLNKIDKLPRMIILVIDKDLIETLNYKNYGVSTMIGTWLEWVANTLDDMIETRKKQLKDKALKERYPEIFWVECPHNKNFVDNNMRAKFNICLGTVVRMFDYMRCIKMKEFWRYDDESLVDQFGHMTQKGQQIYWKSVDASIKFNYLMHSRKRKFSHTTTAAPAGDGNMVNDPFPSVFERNKQRKKNNKWVNQKTNVAKVRPLPPTPERRF